MVSCNSMPSFKLTTLCSRLVGDKCTLADLAFIKCNDYTTRHLLGEDFDFAKEFPNAAKWHAALMARPAVARVFDFKAKQDCGRERQHVTGETHSSFAVRATGYARKAIAAHSVTTIQVNAS